MSGRDFFQLRKPSLEGLFTLKEGNCRVTFSFIESLSFKFFDKNIRRAVMWKLETQLVESFFVELKLESERSKCFEPLNN